MAGAFGRIAQGLTLEKIIVFPGKATRREQPQGQTPANPPAPPAQHAVGLARAEKTETGKAVGKAARRA